MKRLMLSSLAMLIVIVSDANDITIEVKDVNTNTRVSGLAIDICDTNKTNLAQARELTDSSYFAAGLSVDTVVVSFVRNNRLFEWIAPTSIGHLNLSIEDAPGTDTVNELNEIVVEANRQYIVDNKAVFIPTDKDKKISDGGYALLRNLSIPTLSISLMDNSIKTILGEGVSVYVDYLPASEEQIMNIRAGDIKRIEVIDYPQDPRFEGARHVVHFILVKYEYGGYTTLRAQQTFIDNKGNYSIGSKLTYRQMTYDFNGGYSYQRSRHYGEASSTNYIFDDMDITRDENIEESLWQNRRVYANMRAVYNGNNKVISNSVGISSIKNPDCYQVNATTFSPAIYPSENEITHTDNKNFSPTWNGNYQFFLPNQYSLTFSPTVSYSRNERNYLFNTTEGDIINDVEEDVWNCGGALSLFKSLGNVSLTGTLFGNFGGNNLEYTGTMPASVRTRQSNFGGNIRANGQIGRFWFQGNAGLGYEHSSIDGCDVNELLPRYFIIGGYSINNHNSIMLSSEYSNWTIAQSRRASNIQILNQIDAITGNPELETYRYNSVALQYQWMPNNNFSMAAYCMFNRFTDPISAIYEPMEDADHVMLRSYVNAGFQNTVTYGGSFTLRLFNNSLTAQCFIRGTSTSNHGAQMYMKGDFFSAEGWIQYTKGNFWVSGSYRSPQKEINTWKRIETPQYYSLSCGWGNGNLNVYASANNIFNSSWESNKVIEDYTRYDRITHAFSPNYHRSIMVSVSYTFNYGKKVERGDDLEIYSTTTSGILK